MWAAKNTTICTHEKFGKERELRGSPVFRIPRRVSYGMNCVGRLGYDTREWGPRDSVD